MIEEFIGKLSIETRQYASYQRKYFRKKFKDFFWLKVNGTDQIKTIENLTNIPREEYENIVKGSQNQEKVEFRYDREDNLKIKLSI